MHLFLRGTAILRGTKTSNFYEIHKQYDEGYKSVEKLSLPVIQISSTNKKWKVRIAENVVKKLENLSEKDQKKIMAAIEKIADDPFSGKPFNAIEIKPWKNEICKCGHPFLMLLEADDNEVHFACRSGTCDESFWCTKNELIQGRKNYIKKAKQAGKNMEYKGLESEESSEFPDP